MLNPPSELWAEQFHAADLFEAQPTETGDLRGTGSLESGHRCELIEDLLK
jgi:hypothetical protein